nr:cytochrome c oxidase subunit II [Sphingomicrobium nitratireducens]
MKLMGWVVALAAMTMAPAAMASETGLPAGAGERTELETEIAETEAVLGDAGLAATSTEATAFDSALPEAEIGVPDGRKGIQEQVTDLGQQAADFHDNWLLVLCVVISVFVLGLLAYAMLRFRRGANPEPSRTSHNTLIEVVWTVVPVIILVVIAVPSISLIKAQYSPPPADVTVKVIGNQWYWTYEYPDNGIELVSNLLKEEDEVAAGERFRTDADGPALLAVDERVVIPAGKVVKFLVTSNDVIHSFAVPAFWTKMDAVPGRINETWVKVDRPGVYFGMCSELCGARHGYMPIAVEVVPEEKFAAWVASKGGSMKGAEAEAAAEPAATADADAAAAATPAEAQPNEAPAAN